MYRILERHSETGERRDHRVHPVYAKPELMASGPNQVWSWDITKLRGPVKYSYFYGSSEESVGEFRLGQLAK
jgi:transposase InsO family protein